MQTTPAMYAMPGCQFISYIVKIEPSATYRRYVTYVVVVWSIKFQNSVWFFVTAGYFILAIYKSSNFVSIPCHESGP